MGLFDNDTILNSIGAVARHFGKSKRTVFRWQREGMPVLTDGRWDSGQIRQWLERRSGGDPGQAGDTLDLTPAPGSAKTHKARLEKARADLAEMEAAQRRGELISRAEVERQTIAKIMDAKTKLLFFEKKLPPLLANRDEREIAAILRNEVVDILNVFADRREIPKQDFAHFLMKLLDGLKDD